MPGGYVIRSVRRITKELVSVRVRVDGGRLVQVAVPFARSTAEGIDEAVRVAIAHLRPWPADGPPPRD